MANAPRITELIYISGCGDPTSDPGAAVELTHWSYNITLQSGDVFRVEIHHLVSDQDQSYVLRIAAPGQRINDASEIGRYPTFADALAEEVRALSR